MTEFYSPTDTEAASDGWGANCGPAAIAAAFGLEVAAVREAVSKNKRFPGYMGIPDIQRACKALGRPCTRSASDPGPLADWPHEGTHIAMCQFDGPWQDNMWEAAKRRHLVALRWRPFALPGLWMVYDVNAGTWMPSQAWMAFVMTKLAAGYPEASGDWHFSWRGTLTEVSQ